MVNEKDKRDRAELAEHEQIAKGLGMDLEEYIKQVIYPAHLSGAMPIFGLLHRDELRQLDTELGQDWWKQQPPPDPPRVPTYSRQTGDDPRFWWPSDDDEGDFNAH